MYKSNLLRKIIAFNVLIDKNIGRVLLAKHMYNLLSKLNFSPHFTHSHCNRVFSASTDKPCSVIYKRAWGNGHHKLVAEARFGAISHIIVIKTRSARCVKAYSFRERLKRIGN